MPPASAPREDDDVVEDYEVLDEQPSRPASKSGGGKPVLRKQPSVNGKQQPAGGRKPTAPMRPGSASRAAVPQEDTATEVAEEPPPYDPNKGKISSRASLQIWIVCIAITVLGLGAVGADIAFDPLGRRNNSGLNTTNNKQKSNSKAANTAPKDPLAEKAEAFKRTCDMEMTRLMQKKPYKFYRDAYHKFRATRSTAYDVKADEKSTIADRQKAWAEVYRDYFLAQYAKNMFMNEYRGGADDGFEAIALKDEAARMKLVKDKGNDVLKEGNLRFQAATSLVDAWAPDVNEFWTGVRKGDSFVGDVFSDDKHKPIFKAAKDKYEKSCQEPPVFDQADLDAIKE